MSESTFKWKDETLYTIQFSSEEVNIGYLGVVIDDKFKLLFKFNHNKIESIDSSEELNSIKEHFLLYRYYG